MEATNEELLFTDVYTWGNRARSGFPSFNMPKNLDAPSVLEVFEMKRVIQVESSNDGSLALTANGEVWGWGPVFASGGGRYISGYWIEEAPKSQEELEGSLPHRLPELVDYKVKKVALSTPGDDGQLLTWCARKDYVVSLGRRVEADNWKIPQPIFPEGSKAVDVAVGEYNGICLLEDRNVYTWGMHSSRPELVKQLSGLAVRQIAAGGQGWFAVVTEDNDLYTWGTGGGSSNGDYLGHGSRQRAGLLSPKRVKALQGKVKFVKCGFIHMGAVTVDGDVYTWGDCDTNRLGHEKSVREVDLPRLNTTLSGKGVVQLSHARGNEAALTESGELYVWGGNSFGGQFDYPVPTLFSLWQLRGNQVRQVSCGRAHTTLLTTRRLTLKDVCVRYLCNNMALLPDFQGEDLPEELREYMALYLLDRKRLTTEIILRLGLSPESYKITQ